MTRTEIATLRRLHRFMDPRRAIERTEFWSLNQQFT
jgi:hypothetical protein